MASTDVERLHPVSVPKPSGSRANDPPHGFDSLPLDYLMAALCLLLLLAPLVRPLVTAGDGKRQHGA